MTVRQHMMVWRLAAGLSLAWSFAVVGLLWLAPRLPRGSGELLYAAAPQYGVPQTDLYRMDIDRGLTFRLTDSPASEFHPDWSPDGERIAFVSERDGNREIYVMNADGSDMRRLTRHPAADTEPAWSPDGQRIAFVTERFGYTEIMVVEASGANLTRLTDNNRLDTNPAWSPDGQRIAFASDRDARWNANIYVMDADGANARVLQATPANDWSPAWSPDGTRLLFVSDFGSMAVILADLSGGPNWPLFTNNYAGLDTPVWSPDGRSIAFMSVSREGEMRLVVMDAACADCPPKTLPIGLRFILDPRWKP